MYLKETLSRILKTVLEKRNEMPCFEPEEVIFLTNQWDNIKNKKDDGDEEDPHTKTMNQIKSKLEAGWPSFCTDRLFKISLEQVLTTFPEYKLITNLQSMILESKLCFNEVRKRQKTPFTTEFKNFQLKLDETIEKNKNKRVEYYFRFVKRFAANAEMGIVSRINLLKQSDEDRKKLVEKNEETVIQLFRVTDKNKKAAEKYKNEVITKLAKLLLNYLMSENGRNELLSPPGRKDINSVPLTSFTEDIFTRINIGINRWCAGEDVQKVIREIESKMKDLLSDVQTMIHNIEEDITGFTRSINDVSFCVFTRSALRVTLMSNGITFLEYVRSLVEGVTLRDLSRHLVKEKRAIAIYEKWLSTFTYDHILDSFEENFGAEYDKVIHQIFGVEIPQKIAGFRFTINKLLAELNDNKKKNRSFTELQRLVQDLHTRIEEFEDEALI